jgi:hypothetical protein
VPAVGSGSLLQPPSTSISLEERPYRSIKGAPSSAEHVIAAVDVADLATDAEARLQQVEHFARKRVGRCIAERCGFVAVRDRCLESRDGPACATLRPDS